MKEQNFELENDDSLNNIDEIKNVMGQGLNDAEKEEEIEGINEQQDASNKKEDEKAGKVDEHRERVFKKQTYDHLNHMKDTIKEFNTITFDDKDTASIYPFCDSEVALTNNWQGRFGKKALAKIEEAKKI